MSTGPRLGQRLRVALADYPVDAAWSADGKALVVAGGEGKLYWIDSGGGGGTGSAGVAQPFGLHAGGALALAWRAGGAQFASSGQDGEVRLWEARTREYRVLQATSEWSEHLAFASHGRLLAVATGRALQLYPGSGEPQPPLPPQPGVIAALAWKAKGSELAAVGNGGARIHRLEPAPQTREYPCPGACLTASWSPDGRFLAAGMQDGSVHYWNLAAGTQSQMRGYGAKVALTGWSANGRLLATAADEQVVVWDFGGRGPEGSEPLQLHSHTARVTALACQPRGTLIAAGARDHRVTLWRPAQPQQPIDADLLADEIALLRWSNDGEQLAVADRSGDLRLYALRA